MAGKIAQSFIDDLLTRGDIVEIVGRSVQLKKAGRDFQGLCPFHNEKTPSFTVSPEKQFYHCFGCGAHGSALGFLMNHDSLSFVEAVEELAGQLNLPVQYETDSSAPATPSHRGLYDLMHEAQLAYARLLREHPARERAVEYLKMRGLTGAIAKTFHLGYAPPGWDALCSQLGTDPVRRQQLIEAGLAVQRDNGSFYDRFRDRVIFPILDRRGRCVGFGGRVIDQGEPKYLNSPETPIFHKRRELYGLHHVLRRGTRPSRILVVEGYMDVVALAQHGVENAVATLGTATTAEHLEQIFRYVSEVVFCFDGDKAGRRAAWRGLETVLPLLSEGRKAGFLFLPQGDDPDSLVRREGSARFEAPEHITPLSRFLFDELAARADISSMDGRAQLVALARPLIGKVPAGPFRQLLAQHLQSLAQTSVRLGPAPPAPAQHGAKPCPAAGRGVPSLIRRAIGLLVRRPNLAPLARDLPAVNVADDPESALLITLLERLERNPLSNAGSLFEALRGTAQEPLLEEIMAQPILLAEDLWATEFSGAIEQLARQQQRQKYRRMVNDRAPRATPEQEPPPAAEDPLE